MVLIMMVLVISIMTFIPNALGVAVITLLYLFLYRRDANKKLELAKNDEVSGEGKKKMRLPHPATVAVILLIISIIPTVILSGSFVLLSYERGSTVLETREKSEEESEEAYLVKVDESGDDYLIIDGVKFEKNDTEQSK